MCAVSAWCLSVTHRFSTTESAHGSLTTAERGQVMTVAVDAFGLTRILMCPPFWTRRESVRTGAELAANIAAVTSVCEGEALSALLRQDERAAKDDSR